MQFLGCFELCSNLDDVDPQIRGMDTVEGGSNHENEVNWHCGQSRDVVRNFRYKTERWLANCEHKDNNTSGVESQGSAQPRRYSNPFEITM